jgi:hypothetical protein
MRNAKFDVVAVRRCRDATRVDSSNYRNEPKKHRGGYFAHRCVSFQIQSTAVRAGIGLCEAPDLDRRTAAPFAG